MSTVNYLVGSEDVSRRPRVVFDDAICDFVADFSKMLLANSEAKTMPDVLSLAFWCRKANILRLKQKLTPEEHRLGRGLTFHITPSNVPVNFAFSYIFSLLAGNSNIVRVPSKNFTQNSVIIKVLRLALKGYPEIAKRTAIVQYPANDEISTLFSMKADVRIIWGGDDTVNKIRSLKSKARCQDICFADRFSFAVLDAESVKAASEVEMKRLARGFYNDTYLMDQNACSSPQIIFWQNASEEAREKFWFYVENEAKTRYHLQPASAVDKFVQSCSEAVSLEQHLDHIEKRGNLIYQIKLKKIPHNAEDCLRGSCGYFYECDLKDLQVLKYFIDSKCQTVTYYGPEPALLRDFVMAEGLTGIDRIVPVGSAMDIGLIWDGFDLIRQLSRIIDLSDEKLFR